MSRSHQNKQQEALIALQNAFNLALAHHQAGRLTEAEPLYRQVLAADPKHSDALHLLGLLAADFGHPDQAISMIEQAIHIRPDGYLYYSNLGNVLRARGRLDEAVARYEQAIAIKADYTEAFSNLGTALLDQGKYDQAVAAFEKALALKPDYAEASCNLGIAAVDFNHLDHAVGHFRRAIASRPDLAEAHYCLGQTLLRDGKFEEGWPEYDWRWTLKEYGWLRNIHGNFPQPLWTGERFDNRTLLIYAEQGMGDVIQFCRYVPDVARMGDKVVFAVHPRIIQLVKSLVDLPPNVTILAMDKPPLPPFDIHCPLLSLPRVLKIRLDEPSDHVPYLQAEAPLVERWRERLSRFEGLRIGIAWQGNPFGKIDRGRSLPLAAMAPLAAIPGVRLISLQQRDGLDQLENLPAGMVVERLGDGIDTVGAFVDTAAIMANLDLIITSDTSTCHLAGALGRPVWTVLKQVPDWRWLLDRPDSPAYPTMRLFRQQTMGDWAGVFQAVAALLSQVVRDEAPLVPPQPPRKPRRPRAAEMPLTPVSWGELIDKIAILEIKSERLTDEGKIANVRRELDELAAVRERHFPAHAGLAALAAELKAINEELWVIEDDIRDCERAKDFGPRFIELARAVYVTNDRRAASKRKVNDLLGSALVEEKSYAPY